jgi:hypothetical protein
VNGSVCYVFAVTLAFMVYSILGVFQSELGSHVILISSCPSAFFFFRNKLVQVVGAIPTKFLIGDLH